MKTDSKLELGTVRVHKKVLAEIIFSTINNINGIILIDKSFTRKIIEYFASEKSFPGIQIRLDDQGGVHIEVKVKVRYGLNIPGVAKSIQDDIKTAIRESVDIQVKDINVNIQGIYGKQ